MLSISGLGSSTALKLIDATREKQLTLMSNDPVNKRAEQAFRERIGSITSPKELIADYEVYSFVMRAFDLEEQIFGKGLIRKMLESDPVAPDSLMNRLSDSRFRELHLTLGFTTEAGPQVPDLSNSKFQDALVAKFYNRQYIDENDSQNETVGTILQFRDKFSGINNWFQVLSDEKLTNFFQVSLGLPQQMASLDIDKQKKLLAEKFDLKKLADPDERQRLITKFAAISDVLNPQAFQSNNTALNLLQSSNLGGQFVPFTIDISAVTFSASRLYR
ncbi:DUF1217 domain-containing protein [Litorimonas sp.]|jgi:uncharacterized protein DUF1217|uniref:DUF1217 domain-containing protein n=1 Tax=Alphaproteobacteria TaxID=28211 RepID=UPI000C44B821|nr:hypothetical protein [Roseobacter sp.]MBV50394.1 hypothetical protein [Roseobacter sp.]|tara:strand:- start:867 stop:1691 length:825 start_codon:yes stop_codon:yes gene_type:complete